MTTYITGDKHGSAMRYKSFLNSIENPSEEDVIIVCGDAGLEYGTMVNGAAKKVMKQFPGTWVILRGNHDTRYWREHTTAQGFPHGGWHIARDFKEQTLVQNKYPNIHYLLDSGGLYEINGYTYLMIPGAFSVDYKYRLANKLPYEFNEQLFSSERNNLKKIVAANVNNIDFVCGHTFPISQENNVKYLFLDFIDQSKVDKTTEHFIEELMIQIEKGNKFKQYFGGHYHDDKKLSKYYTMLFDKKVEVENYYG